MDEKGIIKGIGNHDNPKVLIPKSDTAAFTTQPGNKEWASVIECIGINGHSLPAFVIFQGKGKRIQSSWIDRSVDEKTIIQVSPNGWTDRDIALRWIQHFDQYTRPQMRGKYRLLILDGHSSHISPEFVKFCTDNDIIALCLPPHATHEFELQPLDVGIFSALGEEYKKIISHRALFGTRYVDNSQFLL